MQTGTLFTISRYEVVTMINVTDCSFLCCVFLQVVADVSEKQVIRSESNRDVSQFSRRVANWKGEQDDFF